MIHKFLHIIIATTLLLSTSGVTVTAYFCGDHLSGLSILPPSECKSEIKACCIKSEGKKKCCTSDSEFVQIDIDQFSYANVDFADIDIDDLSIVQFINTDVTSNNQQVKRTFLYRPPPLITNRIITFQNFRC